MRLEQLKLARLQSVITIVISVITYTTSNFLTAKSVAFGGLIAVVSTLFLAWRYAAGVGREQDGVGWILRQAYRTAIERFMLVAMLLAAGFGLLKLLPFWLLMGFVLGQLAWLAFPAWMKLENKK